MPGQGRRLGPIVHIELVEDGADAFGQEKLFGDVCICETAGEKLQDNKLPFGQFSGDGSVRLDMLSHSGHQRVGNGRVDMRLALHGTFDGRDNFFPR